MYIDIAFGGIIYAVFSLLFNKPFEIGVLGFSAFCSPSLDIIEGGIWKLSQWIDEVFIFFDRKPPFNIIHHKIIHWPIVLISLSSLFLYYFTGNYYLITICFTNLLVHFVHDSLPPDPGHQWLFPFNTNHYCIDEERRIVSRTRLEFFEVVRRFWEKRGEKGPSVGGELLLALKLTWTGGILLLIAGAINFTFWIK